MTAPPKRHWFRFGLRTMFVVVTVAAVSLGWLVWQTQIVRERTAVLNEIKRTVPEELFDCAEIIDNAPRFTSLRRILGDKPIYFLRMPSSAGHRLIALAEQLFPEAVLEVTEDGTRIAWRDSLSVPVEKRHPNVGTIFQTGLIEK